MPKCSKIHHWQTKKFLGRVHSLIPHKKVTPFSRPHPFGTCGKSSCTFGAGLSNLACPLLGCFRRLWYPAFRNSAVSCPILPSATSSNFLFFQATCLQCCSLFPNFCSPYCYYYILLVFFQHCVFIFYSILDYVVICMCCMLA